MLQKLAEEAQG